MKMDKNCLIQMYQNYINELGQYNSMVLSVDVEKTVEEYLHDQATGKAVCQCLMDGDKMAGFMFIGLKSGDCHPMADYFIAQCYVCPESRRKGIMQRAVFEFINKHLGTYTLDVIKTNSPAMAFWNNIFARLDPYFITLYEPRDADLVKAINVFSFVIPNHVRKDDS